MAGAVGALCLLSALVGLGVTSALYRPDFTAMNHKVRLNIKLANREKSTRWIGPETPYWVPMSGISDNIISAVISSEDTAFWSHEGVDFHEVKEAIKHDIKEKKWAHGASTLTQQVVRNVFLTQEKTLTRKFREILWAREIEKVLTKTQILCFYLNMAEWAPGIYGIKGATNHYFEKEPADVTAKEAAFLAMLLPSPWRYHIYYVKRELTPWAQKRVEHTLTVMTKMGYLDQSEYEVAMSETLFGGAMGTSTAEPGGEEPDAVEPGANKALPDTVIKPAAKLLPEAAVKAPRTTMPDDAPPPVEPKGDEPTVEPAPEPASPGPASLDESPEPPAEDPALKE